MVLAELGTRITRALQDLNKVTIIDEKVLNECLNEITRALLQSDVQLKLVMSMQQNIKKIVNLEELAAGHNKRVIIEKVRLPALNLTLQKPQILSRMTKCSWSPSLTLSATLLLKETVATHAAVCHVTLFSHGRSEGPLTCTSVFNSFDTGDFQ